MKDISKASGYSTSIVSHAINNRQDGKWNVSIRAEVRAKIKAIADKMGYRPHMFAKALKSGNNSVIGIVSAYGDNPLLSQRVMRLTENILDRQYECMVQQIGVYGC